MEENSNNNQNLPENFQDNEELNENVLKTKITYELDNKIYILKMFILQELKKLKLTLEITDKNKSKSIYSNKFSLNDLISLNKYFNKFKDYSKAFNYLLDNYTKVEKTINLNKKQIKIFLLFTIDDSENENNIAQQSIGFNLNYVNNNLNRNKSNPYLASTINNLKATLEKFNSSINGLKLNIDNEKNENKNLKNSIIDIIDAKIKEVKDDKIFTDIKNKIKNLENINNEENKEKDKNILKKKLDEIYNKLDDFNNQINELKSKIDEKDKKYNISLNQIINDNNIEKNKVSENVPKMDMEKINLCMKKINNLEENIKSNNEKKKKMETNINNKLSDLNNKINSELKKMGVGESKPSLKQEISIKNDDNKLLDKIIQEKLNDQINDKLKIYEEKIRILNKKIIDLEIKSQNKLIKDAILKNEQSMSFIGGDSFLELKIQESEEKVNKAKDINTNDKAKTSEKEEENKINQVVENKIQDLKKDLYSMMNSMIPDIMKSIDDKKISSNDSQNQIHEIQEINKSKNSKFKKRIKTIDNKLKSKLNYYNTYSSTNMNNSYNIAKNLRINTLNSCDEEELKGQKNQNISFSNISSNINKIKKVFELNIDTNILNKEDLSEDFFLFSKLKEMYQYNRFIRLILAYRGSRDGDRAKNFHTKCDVIGPNITLIRTKKGFIFGGFTIKSWKHLYKDVKKDNDEYGTEYNDKECFCFSVDLQKIYLNEKPNENVIFCNNKYGAIFCGFFKVFDEYSKNGGICGKIKDNCFEGQEKDYEFNGGEEIFDIDEIEVFQISFR